MKSRCKTSAREVGTPEIDVPITHADVCLYRGLTSALPAAAVSRPVGKLGVPTA